MAIDAHIDFEEEPEDEFLKNLRNQEPPRPQAIDIILDDQTIPPGTPSFQPGRKRTKEEQRKIDKANREARRRNKEEIAERRRALREEQQDKERERRAAFKEGKQVSKEQVLQSRTEAIKGRVQAYSLAASLGFPGYVAASVIDNLFLRPKEDKDVEQQQEYQRQLERYNEALKQDAILQRRAQEEGIRNTPVQATAIGPKGTPIPSSNFPPLPPGPPPPAQPPRIPPIPPSQGGNSIISSIAPIGLAVTGLIQATQFINSTTSKLGNNLTGIGKNIVSNNAIQGSQSLIKNGKTILAGANIPANVVVEGFNTLLSLNQAILDSLKESLGFAPQTLQANVNAELAKLARQIESSQRLDKVTAQLIQANATLDEAWNSLRTEVIEAIGPAIVDVLKIIAFHVKGAATLVDVISAASTVQIPGTLGSIQNLVKLILGIMQKQDIKDLNDSGIMKQIDDFFNVPLNIGRMPNGAMP